MDLHILCLYDMILFSLSDVYMTHIDDNDVEFFCLKVVLLRLS